jgi:hypothetical protein
MINKCKTTISFVILNDFFKKYEPIKEIPGLVPFPEKIVCQRLQLMINRFLGTDNIHVCPKAFT